MSKNLSAEKNQHSSIDFKGPGMIDTSWDFGLLCLAVFYIESHKAKKHDVANT